MYTQHKYMNLLIAYEDKIIEFNLEKTFEEMLLSHILEANNNQEGKYIFIPIGSDLWKTTVRKRILTLLIW